MDIVVVIHIDDWLYRGKPKQKALEDLRQVSGESTKFMVGLSEGEQEECSTVRE